jgi:nicotinate phosphoribosyltransferase
VRLDLVALSTAYLHELAAHEDFNFMAEECNKGELAAFVSFALSFPTQLLSLVDTYNVLKSGVPNFCALALALNDLGYRALGVRLDSGDLAYQSLQIRKLFREIALKFALPWFEHLVIVASNDINEEILQSLNHQVKSPHFFLLGFFLCGMFFFLLDHFFFLIKIALRI